MTRTIEIADVFDWAGYARALDVCLHEGVAWNEVDWQVGINDAPTVSSLPYRCLCDLPKTFMRSAHGAMLHTDDGRFALIHRIAQRILGDPRVWQDTLHDDHVALCRLDRQVRRDLHKMKAFVRFTRVADESGDRYIAWFEPAHYVLRAAAPFFARRFTAMRWAILTPQGSVAWSGDSLSYGPVAIKAEAPAPDAGEKLWLTYYQRIFNPARIKVDAMRREMPVRYWPNLPEARLIAPLLDDASRRTHEMVTQAAEDRGRSRARSLTVSAESAGDAMTKLMRRARYCDRCELAQCATQVVWGEGSATASLMIVGEQPGDREDLEGLPFVGSAGALLRAAIAQLAWPAKDLYLTNAVKHFKYEWRGKRRLHKTPAQREAEACRDWLEGEIALVRPKAIIALGATAAASLLHEVAPLMRWMDAWQTTPGGTPVWVAHHPAALLRRGFSETSPEFARWVHRLSLAWQAPISVR
jgi:uracil-DNA glycosylase